MQHIVSLGERMSIFAKCQQSSRWKGTWTPQLVGGFKPFQKTSQIGTFPQVGANKNNFETTTYS